MTRLLMLLAIIIFALSASAQRWRAEDLIESPVTSGACVQIASDGATLEATSGACSSSSGTVTGTGSTGTVPLWSSSTALTDSVIVELSDNIGIGKSPSVKLDVNGAVTSSGAVTGTSLTDGTATLTGGNLTSVGTTQLNTVTYTWPGSDGTDKYRLQTNGLGTLSWGEHAGDGTEEAYLQATMNEGSSTIVDPTLSTWECAQWGTYSSSEITEGDNFSEVSEGIYKYDGTTDSTGVRQFQVSWNGTVYAYSNSKFLMSSQLLVKAPDSIFAVVSESETWHDQYNDWTYLGIVLLYWNDVNNSIIVDLETDSELKLELCFWTTTASEHNITYTNPNLNFPGITLTVVPIGSTGDEE